MVVAFVCIGIIMYLTHTKIILKLLHPLKYEEHVYKYSDQYDLDPFLVFAIIKVESNYNKYAVSPKGAKGLMQITDKTAVWAAEKMGLKDFSVSNLFDPAINIQMGCWYLNQLKKEFNEDIILIIAAYNGGSGRVKEWLKNQEYSRTGKSLDKIPFLETEKYIEKVLKEYKILKYIYSNYTSYTASSNGSSSCFVSSA